MHRRRRKNFHTAELLVSSFFFKQGTRVTTAMEITKKKQERKEGRIHVISTYMSGAGRKEKEIQNAQYERNGRGRQTECNFKLNLIQYHYNIIFNTI